jgi:copper transport protein
VRGGLFLVALAAVLLLARPEAAFAHAEIDRADPPDRCAAQAVPRLRVGDPRCQRGVLLENPPGRVQIWFSESVQPLAGGIHVLAPSGRRIDQGPPTVTGPELSVPVAASETGTYLVVWQVIAEDTHPARGQFAFSVGHESDLAPSVMMPDIGGVSPLGLMLQILARWLHGVGFALSFGVVGFWLLVTRPAGMAEAALERRLWRLVSIGVVVLLAAEPVALLAQSGSLGADQLLDPDAIGSTLGSAFGRVWAQRVAAALALWALLGVVPVAPRRAGWAILGLGLLLAVADGQATHAANTRPVILGLLVNGLHLAAMGAWFGGVLGVLSMAGTPLAPVRHQVMMARAGRLVWMALLTLAVTGVVMATQQLGGIDALASTTYGRALLAKLIMVAVTLALAVPALRSPGPWARRWRLAEAVGLLLVVGLAGLLVALPPRQ